MAMNPREQERPWLAARLDDLLLDAKRYQRKAEEYGWSDVAERLGRIADDIASASVELETEA